MGLKGRGGLLWSLVMISYLAACGGVQRPLIVPSTPLATQTIRPSVTNTPLPMATATAIPTARFTYQGITLRYANGLLRRLTTDRNAAVQGITGLPVTGPAIYYFGVPDFLLFNFEHSGSSLAPSRLVIQPLRDEAGQFYKAYSEAEIGRFTQLAAQIVSPSTAEPLTRHLAFENGTGLRSVGYLPVISGTIPVSDAQIFYLFEGLTEDGRYYIWLQFNLQTPILPDEPGHFSATEQETFDAETADYQTYLRQQLALVQALPTSAFTPDLYLLDALVQSLFIPPEASLVSSLPVNDADCTNSAAYITNVTIPNGAQLEPGQTFLKTWRVQNRGSCTWSAAYQLVSSDALLPRTEEPTIPVVLPGETADLSISYRAPLAPGLYQESWQLQAPIFPDREPPDELFGPTLTILIEVRQAEP